MRFHPFQAGGVLLAALLATGCIEKERPVAPRPPSELSSYQVGLGDGYGNRSYFDLATGEVVASHPREVWDLAFSMAPSNGNESLILRMNTSRFMRVISLENASVADAFPMDIDESLWAFDSPLGPKDELAMGPFPSLNDQTWLLDLGYSSAGQIMGTMMVSVQSEGDQVSLQYQSEDGVQGSSTFTMDSSREWTYFSLLSGETVSIEPELGSWHLMFSSYTEIFESNGAPLPYLVTGVLSIPEGVQVFDAGTDENWDDLFGTDWDDFAFTDHWNAIGYDWKSYSIELGEYSIDDSHLYGLRDDLGREFLFRFLDFYDAAGNAGTITIEIRER